MLTEEYSEHGVHVANVVIDGLIDSPGTHRGVYRIDQLLRRSISQDDIGRVDELVAAGNALMGEVEWKPILEGEDKRFKVERVSDEDGARVEVPLPAGSAEATTN